jgi:predicted metalloprotease with PDZ domain
MPLRFSFVLAVCLGMAGVSSIEAADNRAVVLDVDAREAPRKIFHAKLTIPAAPGALTLAYPKWIPGEHGPTGPIADLAGLRLSAAGKTVSWKRDSVDMYRIHCDVPAGADAIEVNLDYLSPAETGQFSSGASATANLALVSWNQLLLYPAERKPDEILFAATIRLPQGWKWATALERAAGTPADVIRFATVSLTTLVDSPLLAGAYFRVVTLTGGAPAHRLDIAADSDAALAMSAELEAQYRSLVAETGALFGARHYRHYDFLLTLSDHTAHFGLEHHESSDDRVDERSLVDADRRKLMAGLLPHEMTHSWNGKYEDRPVSASGFQEPCAATSSGSTRA